MKGLEVKVQKKLKGFRLDMEFALEEGCLGILGASGCGKSMTLKSVAGLVSPDAGSIRLDERVLFDSAARINLPPQQRRVGYLFQNYALFPNMTVAENIAVGIRENRQEKERMIRELTERFRLTGLEKQYPGKLSGGQQQRAALARIVASRPDMLLLDEPFSAMDSYLREELQFELRQCLQEFEGCAVIVSHDRDEIYKLCSRTMIMGQGSHLISGNTKELFDQPQKMAAARLTGCKNISRAKKLGNKKVLAVDWGTEFTVKGEITDKTAYIGIRAHDFIPAAKECAENKEEENLIPVAVTEETRSPFERTILFKNAGCPGDVMWMKLPREERQIPEFVRVDAGRILLLEE